MAVEVAKACLDRGYNLIPMGFTGPNQPEHITVTGAKTFVDVELVAGPGLSDSAGKALSVLKELHPNLIIVDYTHPSAILNNLACYVDNDCDFVMGTTGGDTEKMMEIFNKGKNKAVIAPNMAKQIVALQAALQEMSNRFPKSFADYKLTVRMHYSKYRHHIIFRLPNYVLYFVVAFLKLYMAYSDNFFCLFFCPFFCLFLPLFLSIPAGH